MTTHHRRIPEIPHRPISFSIAKKLFRSYPVGRKSFSRACRGRTMTLVITSEEALLENTLANLITTMNSKGGVESEKYPFLRVDERTLLCKMKPKYAGLYSFRAEFSIDNGKTWIRDTVPDAWVLVDPRQIDSLRLYTLIPNVSGTISDWKKDLIRIKNMGFNAIHLLPITVQDRSQSPYSAKDLFEIEPAYIDKKSSLSGLEQLEEFVEEAKRLHLELCFDLVLNHVGVSSNIATQAPDWIAPDAKQEDGLKRAGYWCDEGWLFWEDLVLVNYEHPSQAIKKEIWNYMLEYALFWAKFANYTNGFIRFDNLHSSNPEFIQKLSKTLCAKYPNVGIIAEYFTDEDTLLNTSSRWRLNLSLATPWDYKFVPQLREYLKYIHHISMQVRYFMPVSSHDSGTPSQEFGCAESTIPRYVAAALLGTGATGIVQGVEYGVEEKIDFMGKKLKMNFPFPTKFDSFITQVNTILARYPAFRRGGNCKFVDNKHEAILAVLRQSTGKSIYGFLVVCNFDTNSTQFIDIDLSKEIGAKLSISYCELLSDQLGCFEDSQVDLELAPNSAKVLMLTTKNKSVNSLELMF